MSIENKTAYLSLRKSLDSFRDVALTEYSLITSDEGKQHFADFITQNVKTFLEANKEMRKSDWDKTDKESAGRFRAHADEISANRLSLCPPGFKEIDGLCVPITLRTHPNT